MFGILDHHVEGIERLLARERSYLRPRYVSFGARYRRADRCQESRLVDAGDFYFYRPRRLTAFFFPTHLDLAMRIAFKNRRTTHRVNGHASPASDETDDLFAGQGMATQSESHQDIIDAFHSN